MVTWADAEEARALIAEAGVRVERECAEQGIDVEVADPVALMAFVRALERSSAVKLAS